MDVRPWVLYQDDALLVVDKPAGLPTLVDGYQPEAPYLAGLLKDAFSPLWVVHRLDRETSGVIVFARSAAAHRQLNTQFEQHTAFKTYHALVVGVPDWQSHTLSLALRPNGDRRHRTVVDARRGKPAVTELQRLEALGPAALLAAHPHTGRTHQIRVHLAALGYPILGDALYLPIAERSAHPPHPAAVAAAFGLIDRVALHARSLELTHPTSAARLTFEAPYPADFATTLQILRRG